MKTVLISLILTVIIYRLGLLVVVVASAFKAGAWKAMDKPKEEKDLWIENYKNNILDWAYENQSLIRSMIWIFSGVIAFFNWRTAIGIILGMQLSADMARTKIKSEENQEEDN